MTKRFLTTLAVLACGTIGSQTAFATLIFNPTFTANFTANFGVNAAAAQAAWNNAAAIFASNFSDNIHINITVDAVTGTGTLGSSSTPIFSISYSAAGGLYDKALADATSPDDATATGAGGSLGGNGTAGSGVDPVGGAHTFWVTRAQRKALNITGDDLTSDGTTTFGTGFTYDFDPSNGITPGAIDFQGVAAHEISEVMGRIGISGGLVSGTPSYTLLDVLSFSGPSLRVLGNGANANFSINNGTTLLKAFNNQALNGGDSRDWASGSNDSFNAFSTSSVVNAVTAVDIREMDVLGYDLISSVPEPGTISLFAAGLLGLGLVRRRSTRK